jgi:hypothetical protein
VAKQKHIPQVETMLGCKIVSGFSLSSAPDAKLEMRKPRETLIAMML